MLAEAENVPAEDRPELRAEAVGKLADAGVMLRLFLICLRAVIAVEQSRRHAKPAQRAAHLAHTADTAAERGGDPGCRLARKALFLRKCEKDRLCAVVAGQEVFLRKFFMLCHMPSFWRQSAKLLPPHCLHTQALVVGCCCKSCTTFPRRR